MQSLNHFKCHTNCKHKEYHPHAYLGVVDRNAECDCVHQKLTGSSIFLENILDLSHTLAQIMILCGIQECKAKRAVDIITYSFLHYDLVCYSLDDEPSKRLRKEDIFHELGRKCLMNRVEAHLCYNIIKRGFKAFYYRSQHQIEGKEYNRLPSFSEECVYVHAAKKTAESYAQFDGLTCKEQHRIEAKIQMIYKKFFDRMQSRNAKAEHDECNCYFCNKTRSYLVYGQSPLYPEKPDPQNCSHCCKKKKSSKLIHPRVIRNSMCSVCHRSHNNCTCAKYELNLNWIGSIWSRPDMNLYYMQNIENKHLDTTPECYSHECEEEEDHANVVENTNLDREEVNENKNEED